MPFRVSYLFDLTTNPVDKTQASGRTAGWSETMWWDGTINNLLGGPLQNLANRRAAMLPTEASIIGYRIANANITADNRINYAGTSGGKLNNAGNVSYSAGLSQDALMISLTAVNGQNVARHALRALPDECSSRGEYAPDRNFGSYLNAYVLQLQNNAWGMVARDLAQQTFSVMSIDAHGVTTTAGNHNVLVNQFIRFHRVKLDDGTTVQGSYLVTAVTANTLTLANWPYISPKTNQGGLIRRDVLTFLRIGLQTGQVATTRKVGRPFEGFRGRRSKKRV